MVILQLNLDGFFSDINECNRGTDTVTAMLMLNVLTLLVASMQCDCMPVFKGSEITCTRIRLLQINAIMLAIVTNSQFHIILSQLDRHQ